MLLDTQNLFCENQQITSSTTYSENIIAFGKNDVSFVPVVIGDAVFTVNIVASPIISVFQKGESISIPSGSVFEIKILGENEIKG